MNTSPEILKNSRILVTGGAGFIGSALCEYFLDHENEVICLDNFLTGYRENIKDFLGKKNFKLIEGDIRDAETCRKATEGIDYVFHQAALGSVPRSIEDPARTNDININGTLNMLISSRDARVKRFVYASSSSVYGDAEKLPKVEEETGQPLSPYAVTKMVTEKYAAVFAAIYGMEIVGLRYFNVFGRRQDPNGAYAAVIPKWVGMMIRHQQPVINGDGNFSRDFTYIDNVIHANERAGLSNLPQAANVYNVAFGGNITLNELFEALRDNLAKFDPEISKLQPIYGPERPGDIPHSMASIEKAWREIGYTPRYDARSGFEKACKWYWDAPGIK